MKKVLATVANWFIGYHLTEMLVAKRYFFKALVQYNLFNNWHWNENVNYKNNSEILSENVRDMYYNTTAQIWVKKKFLITARVFFRECLKHNTHICLSTKHI
jgi:hypothetical protein